METIYKEKKTLIEGYKDTLALIEKAHPKEDKTPYDMGVCFDMLIKDYHDHTDGKPIEYPFEGMDTFDWDAFGTALKEIQ